MNKKLIDIIFFMFLISIFISGYFTGQLKREIQETIYLTDIDYNNDGKINCKDIQMEIYQCYKGKNYYVQNCRTDNSTDAHAWVKVWINYIPFEGNYTNECKDCVTDSYGKCSD